MSATLDVRDGAGSAERLEHCLQALRDDYERQGGHLDLADVLRAIDRRKLTQGETSELWVCLDRAGLYAGAAVEAVDAPEEALELREATAAATGDSFQSLIRELQDVPKLSPQETVERIRLAQAAATGRLLPDMAEAADRALDELVRANLRFVVYVARQYFDVSRLDRVDVVHQGVLGLLVGIHHFDPQKGLNLRTYAVWWIRQRIMDALERSGQEIRLPQKLGGRARRVRKTQDALTIELERAPTLQELAERLALDMDEVQFLLDLPVTSVSLDETPGGTEGLTIGDSLLVDERQGAEAATIVADTSSRIRELLRRLTPHQQLVIERRFGLDGNEGATLQEIGDELRLSRERVRQIEQAALERLRRDPNWRALK